MVVPFMGVNPKRPPPFFPTALDDLLLRFGESFGGDCEPSEP